MFGMRANMTGQALSRPLQATLRITKVPCSLTSMWLHLFQGLTV